MAIEWDGKIGASTLRCVVSGRALLPGERMVSALQVRDGRFQRDDVAAEAWDAYAREGVLSWWRGVVPNPVRGAAGLTLDPATLMRIFLDLGTRDDRSSLVFRYLVGLCLLRMRKLTVVRFITREARPILLISRKGEAGVSELIDPQASAAEMDAARDDLLRAAGIDPLGEAPSAGGGITATA